ncbi:MAG: hypothetical protein IJV43_07965 [Oscillospiraceae bacterium]|nr:hypothetical protein [Oscillospiraceae bacterium]
MGTFALEELHKRKKDQTVKLIEAADVTRQIAEAVERGDSVATQMLLSEREAPVFALRECEEQIRAYLLGLPEAEAIRMNELLKGGAPETEEEKPLAEQVAQFRRLLDSVTAMDKQLSLRLGGSRSFYNKFRE